MSASFWINRLAFYLFFLACLSTVSCTYYRYAPLSYHGVRNIDSTKTYMYIVDNEHILTNMWVVRDYKFNKDDMSCTLEKVPEKIGEEIVKITSKEDAELNQKRVLLFAKPALTEKLAQNTSITFNYHELDRIQVIEKDHEKTISDTVMTLFVIAALLMGVLIFAFLSLA